MTTEPTTGTAAMLSAILRDSAARSLAEDPPLEPAVDDRRQHTRRAEDQDRTLTQADVDAIVGGLKDKLVKDFYNDLGRGTWAVLWRGLVVILGLLAAYGQLQKWGVMK